VYSKAWGVFITPEAMEREARSGESGGAPRAAKRLW